MKSLKKTLVLLVVLSMILSAVSPVFAFSDVIAEEYAEQANKMAAFGVFTGDANGNFNAEENITRAEMAVVIGRLMGLTTNEANANQYYASNFSDVAAGEWYTGWVNLVSGRGIISGFPDGTFRPNEKVTQAQAVTMIVKALGWGVVVDQTGTWPANYITKASELRLFKNAVETTGELVTRGNVAIYCYNALEAKTWDVTESTDGKLTSSAFNTDTILAKYFSDFVNKNNKMKLVEDAKVTLTGATTTTIGANQVKIELEDIKTKIDAEKEPKRDEENATYYVSDDVVVAYVPAEVANIANLLNKKVDVIFGKDNKVAYLEVVSDVVDNSFVTAWDYDSSVAADSVIEIDGEEYEFADYVTVTVYNTVINSTEAANKVVVDGVTYYKDGIAQIDGLLSSLLVANKTELKRNVVADIELNADDEIEAINFKFSFAYNNAGVKVEEHIVEKVTTKKFEYADTSVTIKTLEDAEPRVVKNNEVASLEDIEAGDVLTVITVGSNIVIHAVSNTVEGTVADYMTKTNALEVDGEEYKVVAAPVYNVDGETDDYATTTARAILTTFEDEEVTVYLNMFGEVVAVVGESEATGMTLGVITDKAASTDEDSNDVEYLKVKILAEDGTNRSYKLYNKNTKKNISDVTGTEKTVYEALDVDKIVVFNADADRIIKSDDIKLVENAGEYTLANGEVTATVVTVGNIVADIDNERITDNKGTADSAEDDVTYKYTDSTVIMNYNQKELISWEALTNSKETNKHGITAMTIFTKGTKLVYVVADVAEDKYGASSEQYGIITDFGKDYDEDGDKFNTVTILTEGKSTTYECTTERDTFEIGDLVKYTTTDESIKVMTTPAFVAYAEVEKVEDLLDDEQYAGNALEYIKVDAVDASTIEFKYTVTVTEGEGESAKQVEKDAYRIVDLDEDVVVYNLVTGEMGEITEGDYVLVYNVSGDADIDLVVIIK